MPTILRSSRPSKQLQKSWLKNKQLRRSQKRKNLHSRRDQLRNRLLRRKLKPKKLLSSKEKLRSSKRSSKRKNRQHQRNRLPNRPLKRKLRLKRLRNNKKSLMHRNQRKKNWQPNCRLRKRRKLINQLNNKRNWKRKNKRHQKNKLRSQLQKKDSRLKRQLNCSKNRKLKSSNLLGNKASKVINNLHQSNMKKQSQQIHRLKNQSPKNQWYIPSQRIMTSHFNSHFKTKLLHQSVRLLSKTSLKSPLRCLSLKLLINLPTSLKSHQLLILSKVSRIQQHSLKLPLKIQ